MLNSARTVLGTADLAGNVVGSVGANAAASEIAVGYRNDRWNSFVNHHDNAAVNSVAKKYGLAVPENSSGQLIENLHTLLMGKFADQDHINMYDAKKSVYKGVIDMFFDDYKNGNKMGNAVSLLGLNVLNYDKTNSNLTTYIGVSSDGTDVAEGYHLQQYHFIVVPNLTDQVTTTTTTDDNGT
ncbi:SEC10/PgrA surface exclusion domain-containing protein [Lactobacillus delbrueckii subsp. bulgaricus]|uniref:SEC10/PgrA surface exclusion domain-containing protein n=1 Tax=Lactobacillus delbrueckii TaxID=1584 RepID=UPI001E446142|nr:SEC10/PgrA surface exclusion domain-containing protein [Lactobacillus delbrueckii]MCD5456627.1 SEC10/PgrA surface exclusion domain-containing protein [Lactobacillus delbrueckii subsp. bulgaricus]MCD5479040.1 SEC10/PgrA surface exclusion domain-containing protein [Lactobacillus delbrueckii subsp. bulgaricus]MEC3724249.1 SEC10/PgrA surface exclusion domain-containing protein [Lactobacillus delbrueckii subsp. bulgaricus]